MEARELILRYQDYTIGAWVDRVSREECPAYQPVTVLFYLLQGSMHIREGEKITTFCAPCFMLYRKNRLGYYRKTWTEAEGSAQTYIVAFNPGFLDRQALCTNGHTNQVDPFHQANHVVVPSSKRLLEVFAKLERKLKKGEDRFTEQDAQTTTQEAMLALLDAKPSLVTFFQSELRTPARSLREIVDHLYYAGITVEELAQQSGRSLSSFYREFKDEFGAPPHKWIMERRLLEAYEILKHQPTSVTRVALDLGFKDLPHFSRRFKGRFGVSPSSLLVK